MGPIRHMRKVVMISVGPPRAHPVPRRRRREQEQRTAAPPTRTSASSPRSSRSSRASTWTRCPRRTRSTAPSRARCAASTRTRSFLDPEMYREMQVETSGSFGGLGIEITLKDDVLTVVAPIEGTPAFAPASSRATASSRSRGCPPRTCSSPTRSSACAASPAPRSRSRSRARGGRSRRTSTSCASRSVSSR